MPDVPGFLCVPGVAGAPDVPDVPAAGVCGRPHVPDVPSFFACPAWPAGWRWMVVEYRVGWEPAGHLSTVFK